MTDAALRVFDADAHVIEPVDLYFDGLDPAFRDRVTVDPSIGDHHGRLMPLVDGRPTSGGSAWMQEYLRTGGAKQVLVDRQGVERAALYPSFSLHTPYSDHLAPDLADALARAYNRWIADFTRDTNG